MSPETLMRALLRCKDVRRNTSCDKTWLSKYHYHHLGRYDRALRTRL